MKCKLIGKSLIGITSLLGYLPGNWFSLMRMDGSICWLTGRVLAYEELNGEGSGKIQSMFKVFPGSEG